LFVHTKDKFRLTTFHPPTGQTKLNQDTLNQKMSMKTRGSTGTKGIGTKRKRENDAADSSGSSSIPDSDHDSKRLRTALTDDAFKNVPLFLTSMFQ